MVRVELDIPNACKDLNVRADRTALLRGAQYIADTWLACISFLEGACYSTQIMRIEDSAGCIREFGPRLRFGNEGDDLRVENMELIALVVQMASTNHWFEMALRDYAAGLRWSQDAAFHCYRALETLCWHYDGNWEDMHSSLGTSRDEINTLIKRHADKIRHGRSLNETEYRELDNSAFYALTYVRDALLAFLIKNSAINFDMGMPVLDHSRNPDHIDTKHQGDYRDRAH